MHNVLSLIDRTYRFYLKFGVLFLCLMLLFLNCQNIQYPEKPKNLIPEDKMVDVLIDVHLFNAAKSVNKLPLQQTGMTPHEFIYEKHAIDSIQFEKSNAYYGAHLNKYERIHLKVRNFLEAEKRELDTLIVRKKRKQDSIKIVTDSLKLLEIKDLQNSSNESKILKKTSIDPIK